MAKATRMRTGSSLRKPRPLSVVRSRRSGGATGPGAALNFSPSLCGAWAECGVFMASGALLFDLGRPSDPGTQVVELGTAHVAVGQDLQLGDHRGVDRKRSLDADVVEGDLAGGERLTDARSLTT